MTPLLTDGNGESPNRERESGLLVCALIDSHIQSALKHSLFYQDTNKIDLLQRLLNVTVKYQHCSSNIGNMQFDYKGKKLNSLLEML